MKKITQKMWVISQLKEYGEISRNQCLDQRITRLSAIIQSLEEENYVFEPKWRGGDYVYVLKDRPVKTMEKFIFEDGLVKRVTVEV